MTQLEYDVVDLKNTNVLLNLDTSKDMDLQGGWLNLIFVALRG